MVSLQLLNALLNVALWALNGIVSRITESVYVSAAKLQIKVHRKTRATDSSETDVFQWLPGRTGVFGHTEGPSARRTAKWVFFLLFFSLAFLPAELYVETGIDERRDCSPSESTQSGLCASPWHGHSDVGIASSALLVQKFTWVDQQWDIVYEGVSPNMVAEEVHLEVRGRRPYDQQPRKILASQCYVTVSNCSQCGTLTVGKDNGAFDTIITHASMATTDLNSLEEGKIEEICPFFSDKTRTSIPYRGDLTYDFATGLAFFFWAQPCEKLDSNSNGDMFQLRTKGVEALLSDGEVERVLLGRKEPWKIDLSPSRTRLYDITCKSPGIGWKDLTKAVSIYRTVQMEQPGLQRTNVNGNLWLVPPLSSSDALKAMFAMKAEDVRSEPCSRSVLRYEQCGSIMWSRTWIYIGLFLTAAALWIGLRIYLGKGRDIHLPHNGPSWRRMAALGKIQNDVAVEVYIENGREVICVTKMGDFDDLAHTFERS